MSNNSQQQEENGHSGDERPGDVDQLIQGPTKRAELIRKLGLANPWTTPLLTPSGTSAGVGTADLTPSGKSVGSGGMPPFWPLGPFFPPQLAPWPLPGWPSQMPMGNVAAPETNKEDPKVPNNGASTSNEDEIVIQLDDTEAQEFSEFDPTIPPEGTWDPPGSMTAFLDKHFNRCLSSTEREAILTDFPKPNCAALQAPRLDDLVKDQLVKKGKDPQFGTERTLFKLQQQLLEVSGPLTCLWADMLNPDTDPSSEEIVLLLQRALVILGSSSHTISLERRRIACTRINPKLKPIASEEFTDRKDQLFGPGFLEKASKKLEADKALEKVTDPGVSRKRNFQENSEDLRSFLSKGAPAKYGGRKVQRLQPYRSQQTQYKAPKDSRYNRKQWKPKGSHTQK